MYVKTKEIIALVNGKNASSKIWECSNEQIVDNVEYGKHLGFKTIKNGKISPDMDWISKWVETFKCYILWRVKQEKLLLGESQIKPNKLFLLMPEYLNCLCLS